MPAKGHLISADQEIVLSYSNLEGSITVCSFFSSLPVDLKLISNLTPFENGGATLRCWWIPCSREIRMVFQGRHFSWDSPQKVYFIRIAKEIICPSMCGAVGSYLTIWMSSHSSNSVNQMCFEFRLSFVFWGVYMWWWRSATTMNEHKKCLLLCGIIFHII